MRRYIILLLICLLGSGCDFLLRIVQKEMAEEKDLFGNIHKYNTQVQSFQETLKEIGYHPGAIDGKIGPMTREAISTFQADYGLKPSGYVDKETWKELSMIRDSNVIYFNKVDLKQIQSALANAGFDCGAVDGKMGKLTKQAIEDFQKENGLAPDGIVGYKTWQALKRYLFEKVM